MSIVATSPAMRYEAESDCSKCSRAPLVRFQIRNTPPPAVLVMVRGGAGAAERARSGLATPEDWCEAPTGGASRPPAAPAATSGEAINSQENTAEPVQYCRYQSPEISTLSPH